MEKPKSIIIRRQAIFMKRNERTNQIKTALNRLVEEGTEGSFLIFENPKTEKFVQFAFVDGLICDIPLAELSREEENKIKSIMGEGARDVETGKSVSYQKWFESDKIDKAVEFVEKIFINIFKLPESYRIECNINI